MTLKKLWMLVLIAVTVMAIAVNTWILAFLTDSYFSDYLKESYSLHVGQIIDYTSEALENPDISTAQMKVELESHLNDPIIGVSIYDTDGDLILSVDSTEYGRGNMGMMRSGMMSRMMGDASEEVQQYDILSDDQIIGVMNITLRSVAENSFVARRFQGALLQNSMISIAIAIIIAFIIGLLVSSVMSRALRDTEQLATDIQLGKDSKVRASNIKEVNAIRESLNDLNTRLKLKQKTRKSLVDRLVHQTRTPLTILKSHIEAIEDGLIELESSELTVFRNQVENITAIIMDMGVMIEAEKDDGELRIEFFDFGSVLRQVISGLRAQYSQKKIELVCKSNERIMIKTDKGKLSQSIYNLLTNAYKYTDSGGTVKVNYLSLGSNMLKVEIQDTGRGIAQSELNRIFEPYYRSSNAKNTKGEGIGLYLVKESIEKIGGTVGVTSELGAGSQFTITVPLSIDDTVRKY